MIESLAAEDPEGPGRPAKRVKSVGETSINQDHVTDPASVGIRHPLGVRPAGNAYLSSSNLKSAAGLFALWPDELIAAFLEGRSVRELLALGGTCKALHAFTRNEEIWRGLFTTSPPSSFIWRGTWRSTLLNQDRDLEPTLDCSYLFSDVLHRPFFCSQIPLAPFASNIPKRNSIRRVANRTPNEIFTADLPVILTNVVQTWPAYKTWSLDTLVAQHGNTKFRAEAVDWLLSDYARYMANNTDESPLYLFDSHFSQKMSLPSDTNANANANTPLHYTAPEPFGPSQDLFSVLGAQRPDHKWLIIGPTRSGSTFHKDPNGTCAWNAVLRGRKYWILFPPSVLPPGVFVSADRSEVTAPLSIAEWLLGFHAEARRAEGCLEGICEAGECIYVPAGWYHLVLNLEDSVALTQNFVPRHRLADVLLFLRDRREQVSGFRDDVQDPYELFVARLKELEPAVLDEAMAVLEMRTKNAKAKWEQVKTDDGEGFAFGFGGGDDDDDDIP